MKRSARGLPWEERLRGSNRFQPLPDICYDQAFCRVRKSQVLDLRAIGLAPDNIEAMSLGKGKDGTDVLILGSDNNFSAAQKTQFYAFKLLRRPHQ